MRYEDGIQAFGILSAMKELSQLKPIENDPIPSRKERVAILDAGAQYGKVIDRRVRGLSVESIILPLDTPAGELAEFSAIIISGGGKSVYSEDAPTHDPKIFELDMPILGICYGMQLMARDEGGIVTAGVRREDGPCDIDIKHDSLLFNGLDPLQEVLMSHGDSVTTVPNGYRAIANSDGLIAAIENTQKKRYGVQFHPEVDLTEHGNDILHNFLYEICGLSGNYTIEDRKEKAVAEIRERVGNRKVLALVSGGVDSTVCAALLNEALGANRVVAVHIDNGFMRQNESVQVKRALEAIGLELTVVDAFQDFYAQVEGVTNPEVKRVRIGDTFIAVAEHAINKLGLEAEEILLAQGTLRPDLIESASKLVSGNAQTIKTHHNDSPAVRKLRLAGRVIEPLVDYHKDEVRELGLQLGLPEEIVWRQPFPGPGLAIRVLCADRPYREDDFVATQRELERFSNDKIRATLLPVQTVGVQGDSRSYSYLVGLSGQRDWGKLIQLARQIPKEIHKVNRVAYIFGGMLPKQTLNITPTYLTPDVLNQLRQADAIVNTELFRHGLLRKLSQVPVVSFPVNFGVPGNRSIAIRTFLTNDFMTGVPALPGKDISEEVLLEIVERILNEVGGISRVVYDLTSKPPGTTEWE